MLAAGFAASLFFTGVHSVLIAPVMAALLSFSAAVVVYPGLRRGRWEIPASVTAALVALWWLYVFINPLWSAIPYNSTLFVYILSVLPLMFFSVLLAPDPQKQALYILYGLGAVMGGLAIWALIQFAFFLEIYGPRIRHPMLDPNNTTAIFGMGSLMAMAHVLWAKRKRVITLSSLTLLLFYIGLLVAQSRGGQLAVLVAAVVLVFMMGRRAPLIHLKLPFIISIAIILYVLVDLRLGLRIIGNFANMATHFSSHASVTARLDLWQSTWQIIKDHPWLGTGLGTFYQYYPAYRHPSDSSDGFFVHLDSLQFWQEMGILGPVLFYGVMIAALLRTIKALKTAEGLTRVWISGAFCALLYIAAHSHITFHFYVLPLLFPIGGLLAVWYAGTEQALGAQRKTLTFPSWLRGSSRAALVSSLVFIISILWVARAAGGVWLISETNRAMGAEDYAVARKNIELARIVSPDSYSKPYEYVGRLKTYELSKRSGSMSPEEKKETFVAGVAAFDQAQLREPRSPYSRNFEAILNYVAFKQGINPGGDKVAEQMLHEILAMDPIFIDARMGLGMIYKERGRPDLALKVLEAGLNWPKPKTIQSVQYLIETGNLRKQAGDEKGAQYMFESAKAMADAANQQRRRK